VLRIKRAIFIIALTCILHLSAYAEIVIKAEVDKKSITTDEVLTYKLVISTDEKSIPAPQVPKFEGFNILSSAQTSQIQFARGIQNVGAVFVFVLAPAAVGKLKIDPSVIKFNNKAYASEAFEIEVTPGKRKPQPKQGEKPIPESEEPQYTL